MALLVPGSRPTGGPTFKSIGRTKRWPATNIYPALTDKPLPSSRSISRLVCSEYGARRLRSTDVPPCAYSALTGNEPVLIKFSKAFCSKNGGTVPGGRGEPWGTTGQPAMTQGVGKNMLFRSHVPVTWLLANGSPVIWGCRWGAGTKKKVRLYLSAKIPYPARITVFESGE